MAKILIIEDEPYERIGLKEEVSAVYGRERVKVAETVEEALDVISFWKPDLILLDIRLKGKSGLEVARYVRKKRLRTEIIIVTAYNEFEYAREAMSFGINHYLSKPVRPQQLLATMREALHKYNTGVGAGAHPVWPLLETDRARKAQDYLGFSASTIMVAGFAETGDKLEEYVTFLAAGLPPGSKLEVMEERIIAYLKDDLAEVKKELTSLAEGFIRRFDQELVLGLAGSGLALSELYQQAMMACNHKIFYPEARILEYAQTVRERRTNQYDYPGTMERQLINLVRRGETDQIDELLHKLASLLVTWSDHSYPVLRTWVETLVNALKRVGISEGQWLNGVSVLKPASFWFSVTHLERDLQRLVSKIHAQINIGIPSRQPLVAKAVNYLLEHYAEDISLVTVARELNISPGYFSRLFKEEVGIPFKNYLIAIRMDKAKQLLGQSGLTVSQVAAAVGYTDPNYFSQAFRKYEGISPSEYKELD
ncbi:MAG TPA: helix-turn-helix domain-containing protein [Firmicutes bacterium]|jgi:two-component system response regulator YesN|nr:helix-turn-helix domain-containing protein [Bacillota bacterium]